jgi:hypothetical protein
MWNMVFDIERMFRGLKSGVNVDALLEKVEEMSAELDHLRASNANLVAAVTAVIKVVNELKANAIPPADVEAEAVKLDEQVKVLNDALQPPA